ncbi:MAG TPA: esterase [Bacteroidia bacterium]|nr:esterase [Bacteroidia bacterium]
MPTVSAQTSNKTITGTIHDLYFIGQAPEKNTGNDPAIILLHGYGSNESDLISLAPQMPSNYYIFSLRAPFKIGADQYQWYEIKRSTGSIEINFEQEEQSRKKLISFIDELVIKYKLNKSKIIVAGFSQGGILAEAIGLTAPEKVAGVACFSGRFLPELKPLIKSKAQLQNKKIFLAHGTQDQLLTITIADENYNTLKALGLQVSYKKDNIGHSISAALLREFNLWLKE